MYLSWYRSRSAAKAPRAAAVAGADGRRLPGVVQFPCNALNLIIGGAEEMKSAEDRVDSLVHACGSVSQLPPTIGASAEHSLGHPDRARARIADQRRRHADGRVPDQSKCCKMGALSFTTTNF